MLKKYAILLSPANAEDSGTLETDEQAASSAADKSAEDGEGQTLEDVVQEVSDSHTEKAGKEESGSKVEPDKGEKGKEGDGKKADPAADGKAKDEDGKELPPFSEHPRWKEVVSERNTLRDQVKEYEATKPLVDQQRGIVDYCQQNRITPQQFQQALSLVALMNNDPGEALRQLRGITEQLGEYDGSRLPKDLETKVAEGNLTMEDAQEIAQLRAQTKTGEYRGRVSAEQQQAQVQQANASALQAWEQNVQSRDPDFKAKADKNAPDGKYEFVVNTFRGLMAVQPPRSPQDIVRLVQQAYDSVNRTFTERLTPKQSTGKRLPSSASSARSTNKEPESIEDIIEQVSAKHGI